MIGDRVIGDRLLDVSHLEHVVDGEPPVRLTSTEDEQQTTTHHLHQPKDSLPPSTVQTAE